MTGIEKIFNDYPNLQKVAFFHSHVLWPSHLETDLELMQQIGDKGVRIISYICNDELTRCDGNSTGDEIKCAKCICKRENGLLLVNHPIDKIAIELNREDYFLDRSLSIDSFKRIKHHNFDVGYATLSSIVSIHRDPYISIGKYYSLFKSLLQTGIALYDFFLRSLRTTKPDLVIIFNGRFVYSRALLRACESLGIPYYTHERGSDLSKYMLFPNTMPHDIAFFNANMQMAWESSTPDIPRKKEIAEKFYIDRMKGKEQSWVSFTAQQDQEKLPDNWNQNKHNIGIFLSSEDEFIAIGDQWENGIFLNQLEGLTYIFNQPLTHENIQYYVRIHPNSKDLAEFIEKITLFENDHITVIPPLSEVSSYKLLNNANKVVTFGSTIGIEAAYWNKPSINLGNSFYKPLDVTYNPKSPGEALDLILDSNLKCKNQELSLQYSYYVSTFGYPFNIYKPNSFFDGVYNGSNLNNIGIINIPYKYTLKKIFGHSLYYSILKKLEIFSLKRKADSFKKAMRKHSSSAIK